MVTSRTRAQVQFQESRNALLNFSLLKPPFFSESGRASGLSFFYIFSFFIYLYISLFIFYYMVATFATPRCIFCHTSLQNAPQKKNAFLIIFWCIFLHH